jgi:hypothetical protein
MPAFDDIEKPEASDYQTEGLTRDKIFEEFCADRETIAALGVTAVELQELSRASLLGSLTCEDDLLFLLRQIRAAMNPGAPAPNEQSIRDPNKLAETIRLAALAKLDELDLNAARRRRSAVGRIELAWGRITMTLSRMQSFVAQLSRRVARRPVITRPVEPIGARQPQ